MSFHLSRTFENTPNSEFRSLCESVFYWFLNKHHLKNNKKCAFSHMIEEGYGKSITFLHPLCFACTLHALFHLTCRVSLKSLSCLYPQAIIILAF